MDASDNAFRIARLEPYWYIACRSRDLASRPIARTMLGNPLVLFRTEDGSPAALVDRCAHRGVPLSAGKVVSGRLECAYHGWRYDGAGVCRLVPALAGASEGKGRVVPAHPTREQQGFVWVHGTSGGAPPDEPFSFPHYDDEAYRSVCVESEVEATLHAALENQLDVPHTAFLHRGLFRGGRANEIAAVVRRWSDRVEAEYVGEPRPSGLVGRLLAPEGGVVTHFDRFLLPSISQVEYRLGSNHVFVTNALTPIEDFRTRIVSVVSFRLPVPGWLVGLVLNPVARWILRQDTRILKLQTDAARRFGGEAYVSTEVDVLGPHIWRLLREAEARIPTAGRGPFVEKSVRLLV